MNKRNLIVMVKCEIGCTYDVAAELADLPEGPTVYSTSGDYDLFTMFRLDNNDDIGHYVCETVQKIEGVRDTNTIVCFNPFTNIDNVVLFDVSGHRNPKRTWLRQSGRCSCR